MIMNCRVTVNGFSVCGRGWGRPGLLGEVPSGGAVRLGGGHADGGAQREAVQVPGWRARARRAERGRERSVMVSVVPRVDGTCQPTDFATHTGVADLDALFAILEPWSVLRPWDFAWAF